MGTFTKGTAPFNKVCDFARDRWGKEGLVHVGQKDSHTYFFRFSDNLTMHKALAKGTWYILNRPMLVHVWGSKIDNVKTNPLWVKFENIPDCYWTKEGLSSLVSVIGPPICADDLTNNVEILPFAKFCVNYTVGKDLPSSIKVHALDPITEETFIEEVLVSYPNKPLICTACCSVGHLVGACPRAVRKWVGKNAAPSTPIVPASNA